MYYIHDLKCQLKSILGYNNNLNVQNCTGKTKRSTIKDTLPLHNAISKDILHSFKQF